MGSTNCRSSPWHASVVILYLFHFECTITYILYASLELSTYRSIFQCKAQYVLHRSASFMRHVSSLLLFYLFFKPSCTFCMHRSSCGITEPNIVASCHMFCIQLHHICDTWVVCYWYISLLLCRNLHARNLHTYDNEICTRCKNVYVSHLSLLLITVSLCGSTCMCFIFHDGHTTSRTHPISSSTWYYCVSSWQVLSQLTINFLQTAMLIFLQVKIQSYHLLIANFW